MNVCKAQPTPCHCEGRQKQRTKKQNKTGGQSNRTRTVLVLGQEWVHLDLLHYEKQDLYRKADVCLSETQKHRNSTLLSSKEVGARKEFVCSIAKLSINIYCFKSQTEVYLKE